MLPVAGTAGTAAGTAAVAMIGQQSSALPRGRRSGRRCFATFMSRHARSLGARNLGRAHLAGRGARHSKSSSMMHVTVKTAVFDSCYVKDLTCTTHASPLASCRCALCSSSSLANQPTGRNFRSVSRLHTQRKQNENAPRFYYQRGIHYAATRLPAPGHIGANVFSMGAVQPSGQEKRSQDV